MNKRVDVTILGGGPTGLFAAFYAGLRGMSVRIIDSLGELGGQLSALYPEKYIYDMPGFPKVLAKDLAAQMAEQAMQFAPEIVLDTTAQMLQDDGLDGYTIFDAQGTAFPTRTVIIAAGAGAFSPTKLGVEREEEYIGAGLSYGVKRIEDFRNKNVVVVGGGDSAFDWCMNLHPVALSVTLVHRRDQFRAHEESVRQVQNLGIEMKLFKTVHELIGESGLTRIVLQDTQTKELEDLQCNALVVNVGFKSSLGPIKDWGLTISKNQIEVDERYMTNREGVFAVGDVCSFSSKIKLIATGVGEAATAVCFAKNLLDPNSKIFPGHSSDMEMPQATTIG